MRRITELSELKDIELEVMKKIHLFCVENDIHYFLCFGTLIGAIRHKGFIPWDDDIDIYMDRNNYEKFLTLFSKECKKMGLAYANHLTQTYYGRNITKVFDSNTILTEPQYISDDPIGVFVDVWPLDGTPNSFIVRKIYLIRAFVLKKMILASSMKNDSKYSFFRRLSIGICQLFNSKKLVIKMEKMAKKYSYELSKNVFSYAGQDALYKKEYFSEAIEGSFEGEPFFIPKEYDKILKLEFGNYMELPPENERIPHHIINTFYK